MPWFMPERSASSFDDEKEKLQLCEARDLGVLTVDVNKIIGSVGRWRDFDSKFRLRNSSTRQRYLVIKRKMAEGHIFPPVHLYKVHDRFYVADGNHRVAAAKELGTAFIDAHVQEYFPCGDEKDAIYWRERSVFEAATMKFDVDFTNPDSYGRLLNHLKVFQKQESERLNYEIGLPEATRLWFREIDAPVRELIRSEGLPARFPGRTEFDLVFYVVYHHIGLLRAIKGPENVTYRDALARLLSAPGRSLMGRLRKVAKELTAGARQLLESTSELKFGP